MKNLLFNSVLYYYLQKMTKLLDLLELQKYKAQLAP